MSLLGLEGLTKYYPSQEQPSVDHLSLELAKGEILALLGP
jgi:ABC-type multidrug transport system ATPase subunit